MRWQKSIKIIGILVGSAFLLLTTIGMYYYYRPEKRKIRLYCRGVILLKEKKYINAIWAFKDALAIVSNDIQVMYHLAKAYAGNEEYDKASEILEKIIELDSQHVSAYLFLSNTYMQQKKYQSALAICDRLLTMKPEEWAAHNERGVLLWQMGYKKQAEYEFSMIIEKNPQDPKSYLHLSRLYWDMKQKDSAIELLEKFVQQGYRDDFDVHLELANYYVALRKYEKAVVEFEILLQKESHKFMSIAPGYAYSLLSLGKLNQAYDIANKALLEKNPSLDSNPKDPILAYVRGVVYLERQQFADAIGDLLWVQRFRNDLAEVHYHLGRAYFSTKKNLLAIQAFETAARFFPDSPDIIRSLLAVLMQEKRWDRALEYANTYLQVDPKNLEIQNLKAQVLIQMGTYEEAEKIVASLTKKHTTLDGQVTLAMLESAKKNHVKSIEILQKIDKTLPQNYYIHFLISQIYFQQKALGPALEHALESIRLNPNYIPSRLLLISIREFLKQYEMAIVEYLKLRQADPEDENYILELANLYRKNRQYTLALKLLLDTGYDQSKDVRFLECYGQIYFDQKQYGDALSYFKQVPPNRVEIYYVMGDCYFFLERYYEALNQYEMAKIENDSKAYLRIAVTLYLQRDWEGAIRSLEEYCKKTQELISTSSQIDLARMLIIVAYVFDNKNDLAQKNMLVLRLSDKKYTYLQHILQSCVYVAQENYIQVQSELQQLAKVSQGMARDFLQIVEVCQKRRANFTPVLGALILKEIGYPYSATLKCEEAMQILANHPVIESIYANLLMALGGEKEKSALERCRRLASNPIVSFSVWQVLGKHAYENGEYKKAEEFLKKVIDLDPQRRDILFLIAMSCAEQRNISEALSYLHNMLSLIEKDGTNQEFCQIYNNLAWLHLELKPPQIKTAIHWAQKAVEKDAWDAPALDTLGWCYFQNQEYNKALDIMLQANRLAPHQPSILYHLGEIYIKLNNIQFAIQCLNETLNLAPNFPESVRIKDLLQKLQP